MSHEAGLGIAEKLNFLDADLRLLAADIRSSPDADQAQLEVSLNSQFKGRFEGLALVTSQGEEQLLFGKLPVPAVPTPEEKIHLQSGRSILNTKECAQSTPCIFLMRSMESKNGQERLLVGQIHGDFLWDAENIPEGSSLCILNETGNALFCSREAPAQLPAVPENHTSGQVEWKQSGEEYLADYWKLFLKPSYHVAYWTVIAGKAKPEILGPLWIFKKNFLLTSLLALWIVILLSLVQIRRNLVPLGELQKGTRRIAGGDFQSRVAIRSGDEFEELASSFNSMAERIEKQIRSLKTMNEIDRAILSASDIEHIVDALIERLPTLVSCEVVSVMLLDPRTREHALTYVSGANSQQNRSVTTRTFTKDELQSLIACREIQDSQCYGISPHHLEPLASRGMTNFVSAPIFLKDEVSGLIALGRTGTAAWTEADREQLGQVTDQMAVALSNARLISELRQLHFGTLTALARAIDAKSPWTSGHSERVTLLALRIASAFGLPQNELDIIHRGGLLHDIGKIGIPGYVLDKPGKLTPGEMEQMREHVSIGARILEPVPGLEDCLPIVWQHHEWINGQGYPKGLKGDEVTLHARILAVADCYDALTSDRPYRAGMSVQQAIKIIKQGTGTQFDPEIIKIFLSLMGDPTEERQANQTLVEAK